MVESGYARDDDGRIPACDLDIVVLAPRPVAQVFKFEPRYSFRAQPYPHVTTVYIERCIANDLAGCGVVEHVLQAFSRILIIGRDVSARLLQETQAVVGRTIDFHDRGVFDETLDGWQKPLPL